MNCTREVEASLFFVYLASPEIFTRQWRTAFQVSVDQFLFELWRCQSTSISKLLVRKAHKRIKGVVTRFDITPEEAHVLINFVRNLPSGSVLSALLKNRKQHNQATFEQCCRAEIDTLEQKLREFSV